MIKKDREKERGSSYLCVCEGERERERENEKERQRERACVPTFCLLEILFAGCVFRREERGGK